jgi:class 3 adenylate cyclase/tetratricopeptide (TPR) repeat protein
MRCSKCGFENPGGMKFCGQCTAALALICPKCGSENPPEFKFCGRCTTPLTPGTSRAGSAKSTVTVPKADATLAVEGERKTVTVLFADIKGSMELIEDLDPEEARAIIDPALKVMIDAVHHYDGYVAQSTGDGVFALFGAPLAHEDHPQRALFAALRMQVEVARYAEKLRAERGVNLQVRVGANTGEVVLREIRTGEKQTEYTPIGHSTSVAARLQALAVPGSIAIGQPVRRLVEGYFALKPLGPARIRGVSEPLEIYEVTGLGPLRTRLQRAAARGYARFVGRQREMETIKHAAELAKTGHGQIVAAVAEPGVGKSRLLYEFKVKHQSEWMVLETLSVSHGKASAYLPMIDLLHGYFGIRADDDLRARREKVNGRIVTLDPALEDTRAYLFGLLGLVDGDDPLAGMDAQIRRQRTLEALKRVLLRESLNQPLMVIFEDLHWIDEETQAFLNLFADSVATEKVLLLASYRPEYSHAWSSKPYYAELRLDPLGRESAGEIFDTLLGVNTQAIDEPLLALKRLVVEKTEGTPLFIEEIVQALVEDGALVRNGVVRLTRPLNVLKIPTTVQAILASRIDRLPAREKELLQILAVIGIEFPLTLARDVTKKPVEELNQMLNALQLGEFIYEQPARGDVEYAFKHALTQEVAYTSLLQESRKVIHERIGQSIETLYADSLDDRVSNLVHHYRRSGNTNKAVAYLVRAASQAYQRSAFSAAAAYLEEALERLQALAEGAERDRKEITIRSGLAEIVQVTKGYAAADYERHLTRRQALAERLGDAAELFFSLVGISILSAFRLELGRAREISENLVRIADQASDRGMQLNAHGSVVNALWSMGDFIGSRAHSEKAIGLYEHEEHLRPGEEHFLAACRFYAPLCTLNFGFPDDALRQSLEFLTLTRRRPRPLALAFALNCVATLFVWRRDGVQALRYSESMLALTAEHGFTNLHSFAQLLHGQALAMLGKTNEAIAEIKDAMDTFEATGALVPGWLYGALGFAYLAAQRPAEGLSVVKRALELGDRTGDVAAKSELHRLKGELLLILHPTDGAEAEASFRAAIDTARKQSARLPELRAITGLGRFLRDTNRHEEARTMLADIYGKFTEGFDTADLKDAKALLDQLDSRKPEPK